MDTQISVPSRTLATERRDAVATDERLNHIAFWYFVGTLAVAFAAMGWTLVGI
jgi:hypothetical protein